MSSGTIEAGINYPGISFKYVVRVKSAGNKIIITADLNSPLPAGLSGKA